MPLEEQAGPNGPSWNEVFHGPEAAAAMKKLDACLLKIEEKHQAYFDALTEAAEEKDKPVRLHNFTLITWNSQGVRFGTQAELREDIALECQACVNSL